MDAAKHRLNQSVSDFEIIEAVRVIFIVYKFLCKEVFGKDVSILIYIYCYKRLLSY